MVMKKNKKNIFLILPDLNTGGAQRMFLNMAQEFACREHKVTIIILCKSSKKTHKQENHDNLRFVLLNYKRAIFSLPHLAYLFRKHKPDVIISALTYINIISLIAKRLAFISKTKIYITERAYHSINAKMVLPTKYEREKKLMRLMYPTANKVIGISQGVTNDIQNIADLDDTQVQTIYNPVITESFTEKENAPIDTCLLYTSDAADE